MLTSLSGDRLRSNARSRFLRLWWRTVFRFSESQTFSGCNVRFFLPLDDRRTALTQKCFEAFELLRIYAPRELARIRTFADGVLVLGEDAVAAGAWLEAPRLIRINSKFVLSDDTPPAEIAATIVHESTHAWLNHHGFGYAINRRQRIEAICFRAEAAFARRIPDGEELAALYEACAELVLSEPERKWSDEALHARFREQLRDHGLPEWLIKAITRLGGGR